MNALVELDIAGLDGVKSIMDRLSMEKLTPTGHWFDVYWAVSIIEAARSSSESYVESSKASPAVTLIEVVLSANRNYQAVVYPNVIRILKDYPDLRTFQQLEDMMNSLSRDSFFSFWWHKDQKKYDTLKNILSAIGDMRIFKPDLNDYELMNEWAWGVNLLDIGHDRIGKIPNVWIATVQHLRMNFGADTVKPDQRVKEVLEREFHLGSLNPETAILAVEKIAHMSWIPALLADQIFVKYGSSHYSMV